MQRQLEYKSKSNLTLNHYSQVIALITAPSREERKLQDEVNQLKTELSEISMRHEYTHYVKTERKLVAVETKLNTLQSGKQTKKLIIQYGLPYGSQFCLALMLLGLSIYYRYTPVIVFDDRFDFVPFKGLIRFPTGVDGALSVPFWAFVNSFVSKHVASYL